MESREAAEITRSMEDLAQTLAHMRRVLELHGETLHRIERKLDQHFAVAEPDAAAPPTGA